LVPNAVLIQRSWAFWKVGGEVEKVAKRLWGYSLLYLPIILGLMMYHKRGMDWLSWMGIVNSEDDTAKEAQKTIQEVKQ
jgi:protoheme IX farnesyltransferase